MLIYETVNDDERDTSERSRKNARTRLSVTFGRTRRFDVFAVCARAFRILYINIIIFEISNLKIYNNKHIKHGGTTHAHTR